MQAQLLPQGEHICCRLDCHCLLVSPVMNTNSLKIRREPEDLAGRETKAQQ